MSISLRRPLSGGQKTASLAVLYFVQGLPYGFQDKLVPLVLIERGHSASSVALTRLLLLPWLAKPLLAPLIETVIAFLHHHLSCCALLLFHSSLSSSLIRECSTDVCARICKHRLCGLPALALCGEEPHIGRQLDRQSDSQSVRQSETETAADRIRQLREDLRCRYGCVQVVQSRHQRRRWYPQCLAAALCASAVVSLLPDGSIGSVRCKPISCADDGRGHLSKSPKCLLLLLLLMCPTYVQACHTVPQPS